VLKRGTVEEEGGVLGFRFILRNDGACLEGDILGCIVCQADA
jgi:hypothetical protein